MKRVFAAVDISDEARRAAAEYISRLRTEFPDAPVRWERPEKLHITVKFAGALDENQLAIFTEKVKAAAKAVEPFRMKIIGTGAFVKRRGPSVLWLGVEQLTDKGPIGGMAVLLGHECREFLPHITIARIKDTKNTKDLIEEHRSGHFESSGFAVNKILVNESSLLPTGSVYTRIAGFRLGASPK